MIDVQLLIDFKELKISKRLLCETLGENLLQLAIDTPLYIDTNDVIHLLKSYANGTLTLEDLLEWVNTVWFTDLFDYLNDQSNTIASVMTELEKLDEQGVSLSSADIKRYLLALEENKEL